MVNEKNWFCGTTGRKGAASAAMLSLVLGASAIAGQTVARKIAAGPSLGDQEVSEIFEYCKRMQGAVKDSGLSNGPCALELLSEIKHDNAKNYRTADKCKSLASFVCGGKTSAPIVKGIRAQAAYDLERLRVVATGSGNDGLSANLRTKLARAIEAYDKKGRVGPFFGEPGTGSFFENEMGTGDFRTAHTLYRASFISNDGLEKKLGEEVGAKKDADSVLDDMKGRMLSVLAEQKTLTERAIKASATSGRPGFDADEAIKFSEAAYGQMVTAVKAVTINKDVTSAACIASQRTVSVRRINGTVEILPCPGFLLTASKAELAGAFSSAVARAIDPCALDSMQVSKKPPVSLKALLEPVRACVASKAINDRRRAMAEITNVPVDSGYGSGEDLFSKAADRANPVVSQKDGMQYQFAKSNSLHCGKPMNEVPGQQRDQTTAAVADFFGGKALSLWLAANASKEPGDAVVESLAPYCAGNWVSTGPLPQGDAVLDGLIAKDPKMAELLGCKAADAKAEADAEAYFKGANAVNLRAANCDGAIQLGMARYVRALAGKAISFEGAGQKGEVAVSAAQVRSPQNEAPNAPRLPSLIPPDLAGVGEGAGGAIRDTQEKTPESAAEYYEWVDRVLAEESAACRGDADANPADLSTAFSDGKTRLDVAFQRKVPHRYKTGDLTMELSCSQRCLRKDGFCYKAESNIGKLFPGVEKMPWFGKATPDNIAADLAFLSKEDASKKRYSFAAKACYMYSPDTAPPIAACKGHDGQIVNGIAGGNVYCRGQTTGLTLEIGCKFNCTCGDGAYCRVELVGPDPAKVAAAQSDLLQLPATLSPTTCLHAVPTDDGKHALVATSVVSQAVVNEPKTADSAPDESSASGKIEAVATAPTATTLAAAIPAATTTGPSVPNEPSSYSKFAMTPPEAYKNEAPVFLVGANGGAKAKLATGFNTALKQNAFEKLCSGIGQLKEISLPACHEEDARGGFVLPFDGAGGKKMACFAVCRCRSKGSGMAYQDCRGRLVESYHGPDAPKDGKSIPYAVKSPVEIPGATPGATSGATSDTTSAATKTPVQVASALAHLDMNALPMVARPDFLERVTEHYPPRENAFAVTTSAMTPSQVKDFGAPKSAVTTCEDKGVGFDFYIPMVSPSKAVSVVRCVCNSKGAMVCQDKKEVVQVAFDEKQLPREAVVFDGESTDVSLLPELKSADFLNTPMVRGEKGEVYQLPALDFGADVGRVATVVGRVTAGEDWEQRNKQYQAGTPWSCDGAATKKVVFYLGVDGPNNEKRVFFAGCKCDENNNVNGCNSQLFGVSDLNRFPQGLRRIDSEIVQDAARKREPEAKVEGEAVSPTAPATPAASARHAVPERLVKEATWVGQYGFVKTPEGWRMINGKGGPHFVTQLVDGEEKTRINDGIIPDALVAPTVTKMLALQFQDCGNDTRKLNEVKALHDKFKSLGAVK